MLVTLIPFCNILVIHVNHERIFVMQNHMHGQQVAYPYVPAQKFTQRYSDCDAIIRGTLFPELDLPFKDFETHKPLESTPATELMKLDFVRHELRLYLDTHPADQNALQLYQHYTTKCQKAKQALQENENWVYDPWPWEV